MSAKLLIADSNSGFKSFSKAAPFNDLKACCLLQLISGVDMLGFPLSQYIQENLIFPLFYFHPIQFHGSLKKLYDKTCLYSRVSRQTQYSVHTF